MTNSPPGRTRSICTEVLDETGAPVRPLEWKDTVDIPHERTVRLAVRRPPGTWIFHCHILDHADGGLLSAVHLDLPILAEH